MSRAKVIVTDYLREPLKIEEKILGDLAEVTALGATTEEELLGSLADADALLVYHFVSITERIIKGLANCKIIVRCGVGHDNVDSAAARARGIPVANVPDYGTEEVADSALGMILSLTRGIHRLSVRIQDGTPPWSPEPAAPLHRLRGSTLGIVGLGRIGTALALRAKTIGFEVVFHDPYLPAGREKATGARRMESLEELLRQSQVVSLHCPGTEETENLIDEQAIDLMPDNAYLVNTARGSCVDCASILDALAKGKLAGAALDVLPGEPPDPEDPLLLAWRNPRHPAHERLLLNPHGAWYCEEGKEDARVKACNNVRRVLLGEEALNVVNEIPKET